MDSGNSVGLGRVIEEVKQHQFVEFWKLAATGLSLGAFLGVIAYFTPGVSPRDAVCFAAFVFALSVTIAVTHRLLRRIFNPILRIHENGVSIVRSGESTEIQYNHLDEYACKKTSYSSADYFELELKSCSIDTPRIINWTSNSRTGVDFDALHVRISERVAENMAAMLKLNHRIPWGDSTYICDDGIECRVKTGTISSETRIVSWSELIDMKFVDAKLLVSFESDVWNLKIPCNEPNLYAGYLLVDRQMRTLFGDWMPSRQTNEEVAIAVADRVFMPVHF